MYCVIVYRAEQQYKAEYQYAAATSWPSGELGPTLMNRSTARGASGNDYLMNLPLIFQCYSHLQY